MKILRDAYSTLVLIALITISPKIYGMTEADHQNILSQIVPFLREHGWKTPEAGDEAIKNWVPIFVTIIDPYTWAFHRSLDRSNKVMLEERYKPSPEHIHDLNVSIMLIGLKMAIKEGINKPDARSWWETLVGKGKTWHEYLTLSPVSTSSEWTTLKQIILQAARHVTYNTPQDLSALESNINSILNGIEARATTKNNDQIIQLNNSIKESLRSIEEKYHPSIILALKQFAASLDSLSLYILNAAKNT